ncbi:MAG: S41 family peptidase [candidate division Zixibacteria bacterium]|nr:S41 family peptidase [candidate division Zixibacteria bacterium]
MLRYTVQLFGLTVFALALIWFAGPGDAAQTNAAAEGVLWADTVHINLDEEPVDVETSVPQSRDTFMKSVRKLTQTAFSIRNNYMEDIDVDEMIKSGIVGMLSDLDRFSVLMEKEAFDDLMENTHGKYSGLGMQIDSRDDRIVIIAPIEGTPAQRKGLRAGDIIWEINGQSTEEMKSSDAAKIMRGEAGTSVTLTIKRAGSAELLEYDVERAVIELKSVNYAGLIPGTDIGYVRLSKFAETTSRELRQAISDLNEQNISGLIFDLRSNGGGLLDQAKETAELFLDEGREIVYTKGREETSERHFRSDRPPLYPAGKPLVILVDEGTASASEIVAGAIQDWDRGILVGNQTYGKGLVQQIFPVSQDGSVQLKLTTAKYYVPSGRCIQKPERQAKPGHQVVALESAEEDSDSLTLDDREVYFTNAGRTVYGGGGIIPDVEVERELWQPIEINLERKSLFFDFAIKYIASHPGVTPDFEVTDAIVNDFRKFIQDEEFTYKSALQIAVDEMRESVKEQEKSELFSASLAEMDRLVAEEKAQDFENSIPYIKKALKREVVSSIAGERGRYEHTILPVDPAIKEAVRIITTPGEYTKIITKGIERAESN